MTKRLSLLDPRDPEAFQRLDRLGRGVLHALEDDQAIAGRNDAVMQDFELMPTPSW